jgi:hypothetical protein
MKKQIGGRGITTTMTKKKVYYCKKYDCGQCCAILQVVAHQNPIVTVTDCTQPDTDECGVGLQQSTHFSSVWGVMKPCLLGKKL